MPAPVEPPAGDLSEKWDAPFRVEGDWVVATQIFWYFHAYLGKIPILTDILQMGWN